MPIKPKSRKATAKTATPGECASLPYDHMTPYDHTTAVIHKMIARLRFLEADCRYHAAIGDQFLEHVALDIRHREERDEIMQRLAKAVPDCCDDAITLLEFATARAKSPKAFDDTSGPIIAMLKNSVRGFFKAHIQIKVDSVLRRFDERWDQYVGDDI